jgi:hypothetical protein
MAQVNADQLFGNIKDVLDACEEFWFKKLSQVYQNVRITMQSKECIGQDYRNYFAIRQLSHYIIAVFFSLEKAETC